MSIETVGFAGTRGMVGSELMRRMIEEDDFTRGGFEPVFLSTSQAGQPGPTIGEHTYTLGSADDLDALQQLDAIVSCQGEDYTKQVHPALRQRGWQGYWIDADSLLRMEDSSTLLLDPLNRQQIDEAVDAGKKDFIGVNCASGILGLGFAGLFKAGLIEKIDIMTDQAVSGAGVKNLLERLQQSASINKVTAELLADPNAKPLDIAAAALKQMHANDFPIDNFGQSIDSNLLLWIGKDIGDGRSSEEKKAKAEINKLLGNTEQIPIGGICGRIDSLRSHVIRATVTLKEELPLSEIETKISGAHEWVRIIPNNAEPTNRELTPVDTSGTLEIRVGRLHFDEDDPKKLYAAIVGDQLLWGAAEPLRRGLNILIERGRSTT